MSDTGMALGHSDGPREHHIDKFQIMGSPEQGWSLAFAPDIIATFLRARMAHVQVSAPEVLFGETILNLDYTFPPGWDLTESFGSMRTAPTGGVSFDALSYGMTFDLLELLGRQFPQNKDMVVICSEHRAFFHRAGMPRNEGIHRLQNAFHVPLAKLLFPHELEDED